MSSSLKIFKQSKRYSEVDRPALHERCFFSHAIALTRLELIPFARSFDRKELHQNAICTVRRNMPHVTEVLFDGSEKADLVPPEFLLSMELTSFGEQITRSISSSATKKFLEI